MEITPRDREQLTYAYIIAHHWAQTVVRPQIREPLRPRGPQTYPATSDKVLELLRNGAYLEEAAPPGVWPSRGYGDPGLFLFFNLCFLATRWQLPCGILLAMIFCPSICLKDNRPSDQDPKLPKPYVKINPFLYELIISGIFPQQ